MGIGPIMRVLRGNWVRYAAVVVLATGLISPVRSEPLVPGTGRQLIEVGDDFEQPGWSYVPHLPKSSRDVDQRQNLPSGEASNGRWYEGIKRGQPDVVRIVPTPDGGLPSSRQSLLLQTLYAGLPGRPAHHLGQDDFVADVNYRLGGAIPVSQSPSVVVRVFLPPADQWENRSGSHFGFRMALETVLPRTSWASPFASLGAEGKTYWPGLFIEFDSQTDGHPGDRARFRVRADARGSDFRSAAIAVTGWWTLGFSVTPDGMVHYYASPGVDSLTAADLLASQFPYGYRAASLKTFFFNVCNGDNGRVWSTPWIIDDSEVYVVQ